jgi:hypothetical protein
VAPEFVDEYSPAIPIATSLLPSAEKANDVCDAIAADATQVTPESDEIYILPSSLLAATSLLPSADDATDSQRP